MRKWRKKGTLGGAGRWEIEVGEQSAPINLEMEGLMESNINVSKERIAECPVLYILYIFDNQYVTLIGSLPIGHTYSSRNFTEIFLIVVQ